MADLYDHIAFYNFLQVPIDGGSRTRPDPDVFRDPRHNHAFREVLEQLRPQRIYVCGKTLWTKFPEAEEEEANLVHINGHAFEICVYHLKDGALAFATCTNHPSSGRYPNSLHEGLRWFIEARDDELRRKPASTADRSGS